MNMKAHILTALDEQLGRWEELLDSLNEEQLAVPLTPSPWTTKDVIAHLFAWQQRSIVRLEAATLDREPEFPNWPADLDPEAEDVDQINDWIYKTNRKRPWPEMYQAWKVGYLRLLNLGEQLAERDLMDESRYPWMQGYSLAFVLLATYDHHQEHYEKLLAWLQGHGSDGPHA